MITKYTAFFTSLAFSALPFVVHAQQPQNLGDLIQRAIDLVNPIVGLLTGLAVLFFAWGIVQYILHAGDEKKARSAKGTMVYGVIALTVLFSFWGIVQFFKDSIFGN